MAAPSIWARIRACVRLVGVSARATVCATVMAACQSPTIPLPPPGEPSVTVREDGLSAELDGPADVDPMDGQPYVMVFNNDLGEGVITSVSLSRRYHVVVPVDVVNFPRNTLRLWITKRGEASVDLYVYVRRKADGAGDGGR